jgi:hypothetical protein
LSATQCRQCDLTIGKSAQYVEKSSQNSCQAKMSSSKLNLEVLNMCTKLLNRLKQICFEAAYFGKDAMNSLVKSKRKIMMSFQK